MEGRIVCKVRDGYVARLLQIVGASKKNDGKVEVVDRDNDDGQVWGKVCIPLYDANEYVKKRVERW